MQFRWRETALVDGASRVGDKPGPGVRYRRPMRIHIALPDAVVAELDRRAGARRRSAFIAEVIRRALEDERRWDDIEAALSALPDTGHAWDDDPAEWVRRQRHADGRRSG